LAGFDSALIGTPAKPFEHSLPPHFIGGYLNALRARGYEIGNGGPGIF
jgi:hypothetical protein